MSEEEKKAIEKLNSYINAIDAFGTIDPKCCNNLYKPTKTVLDIIENLQKEIIDLKQINEEHRKLNGKLREEINKLKKEKEDIIDYIEE